MKFLSKLAPLTFFAPFFAFAQVNLNYIDGSVASITRLVNGPLVSLVFGIAFLMFLWGVFKTFILGGDNEEAQEQGKQLMVYAVIGFVLMTAIWGIVNLVTNITGVDKPNQQINIPTVPVRR